MLIKAEAEIQIRERKGRTSLKLAGRDNQNEKIIESLLNSKANINTYSNAGMTALMFAAYENLNPSIIETLINAGTKVNNRTGFMSPTA